MIDATITDAQLAKAADLLGTLIDDVVSVCYKEGATAEEKAASNQALKAAEGMLMALGFDYKAGPNKYEIVIYRTGDER